MLSIVVPCYNEEAAIPLFFEEVEKISQQLSHSVEYIFVNDGSKDKTLAVLRQLYREHPEKVRYLSFSRNFGKGSRLIRWFKRSNR